LGNAGEFGKFDEIFAALLLFDGFGTVEQAFEIAEFLEKQRCRLHTDSRHARHVIRGVAGEGENVSNLLRADPEFFHDLVAADLLGLHRIEHLNAVADQLHQILV